ncbi:hypothetical protein GCK32_006231 [Trichostrongylus colubriformis]|uniref:Uncharacterized protein n=1 Tax=Trichostrongylus colubriformis TaxID=6319 RepID=A0AAN8EYY7_TRICO
MDTHEEAEGSFTDTDEDLSVGCSACNTERQWHASLLEVLKIEQCRALVLAKRHNELREQFLLEVIGTLREREEVRGRFERTHQRFHYLRQQISRMSLGFCSGVRPGNAPEAQPQ